MTTAPGTDQPDPATESPARGLPQAAQPTPAVGPKRPLNGPPRFVDVLQHVDSGSAPMVKNRGADPAKLEEAARDSKLAKLAELAQLAKAAARADTAESNRQARADAKVAKDAARARSALLARQAQFATGKKAPRRRHTLPGWLPGWLTALTGVLAVLALLAGVVFLGMTAWDLVHQYLQWWAAAPIGAHIGVWVVGIDVVIAVLAKLAGASWGLTIGLAVALPVVAFGALFWSSNRVVNSAASTFDR